LETLAEFKDFKNIERESLMWILEDIFRSALTKKYGPDASFEVIVNVDRGELEIQRYREIVEDHKVKNEFTENDCHFLNQKEMNLLRTKIVNKDGVLNPTIVGQSAETIAKMADVTVKENTKILIAEVDSTDPAVEPFACEKLSPILAMYRAKTFKDALDKAEKLIEAGGLGHTSSIYTTDASKIKTFADRMKTCRILVNTPASQGAIGGIYNKLTASLTLGCGFFGGNSVAGNIGPKHLLNIKQLSLPDINVHKNNLHQTQQEKKHGYKNARQKNGNIN
jgi:hypothetical protein